MADISFLLYVLYIFQTSKHEHMFKTSNIFHLKMLPLLQFNF